MCKALSSVPSTVSNWAGWSTSLIPALGSLRQSDHEFKVTMGHKVSSRTAWATEQDPISKTNKQVKIFVSFHILTFTSSCDIRNVFQEQVI
jgi:hypothetical protein